MDIKIGETYYSGKLSRTVTNNIRNEIYYTNESGIEKHCWITTFQDWVGRGTRLNRKNKTTNADKIRSMSDIELAKLIASGEWSCICPFCNEYGSDGCVAYSDENIKKEQCEKGILNFLQSEVATK